MHLWLRIKAVLPDWMQLKVLLLHWWWQHMQLVGMVICLVSHKDAYLLCGSRLYIKSCQDDHADLKREFAYNRLGFSLYF